MKASSESGLWATEISRTGAETDEKDILIFPVVFYFIGLSGGVGTSAIYFCTAGDCFSVPQIHAPVQISIGFRSKSSSVPDQKRGDAGASATTSQRRPPESLLWKAPAARRKSS